MRQTVELQRDLNSRLFLAHIPTAWSTEIERFIDRNFDQSGDGRETVNRG